LLIILLLSQFDDSNPTICSEMISIYLSDLAILTYLCMRATSEKL